MKKISSQEIIDRLSRLIPNPESELEYNNNFELLIAVMLSAQCTDKRVNEVTRKLFKVASTPEDFVKMSQAQLESYIKSCNYYKTKASNIIKTCKILINKFNGKVPSRHSDLLTLPGVGNKTANVVQAVAFGLQALPVDTHVLRVSRRLGFTTSNKPLCCEIDLKERFVGSNYIDLHHLLLLFGRYYCTAKNPKCNNCIMADICVNKEILGE